MSDVQRGVRDESDRRGGIVVVDGDSRRRDSIIQRLGAQFIQYEVVGADDGQALANLLTSMAEEQGLPVPVVAAVHGQVADASAAFPIAEEDGSDSRLVVYSDPAEEDLPPTADPCVLLADIEAAIYAALLERDLGGVSVASPISAEVLDSVSVAIRVLNPDLEVLWEDANAANNVPAEMASEKSCWKRCYGFCHRECACPSCEIEGGLTGRSLSGCHLLPIRGRIERVEINGSPLLSRDGQQVLAMVETSRLVTSQWEEAKPAHERLGEVLEAARGLGGYRMGAPPFHAVSVYYQPDENANLHLFDTATEDLSDIPQVFWLECLPDAVRDAMEDLEPQFYDETIRDEVVRHFVRAYRTDSLERFVVVDVTYSDAKPDELLTEDLAPYWQSVADVFDRAWETREAARESQIDSAIQRFLAKSGAGIRDDAGLNSALEAAKDCIRKAVSPLSMHVRVLDRRSGQLVKRCGYGPYFNLAPAERALQNDGIGSSWAASERKPIWNNRADLSYINQCLGQDLAEEGEGEDQRLINQIASDVLLPLVCMDRVLGTLCLQFDDDSLYSPAQRRFIEAMAHALGSTLGTREWAHQREQIIKCARELDKTMFQRSERPDEEEIGVLQQVTGMAFELSAAELVAYYRYDPQMRTLSLVAEATQGTLPEGVALPDIIPPDVGVISHAAASKQGILVRDYRSDNWQRIRRRLLASFPGGPQNKFCEWVGSEIAEPVLSTDAVKGVLVALSTIPEWLGADDVEVVREFAHKTGRCLEAKYLTRQLNWNLRTKSTLAEITAAMARVSDIDAGYRHLLLAITADECLGFSRAIVFVRQADNTDVFIAKEAVGSVSQALAECRWKEAEETSLGEKMDACAVHPPMREGDLRQTASQLELDLQAHPDVRHAFSSQKMVYRKFGATHLLSDSSLRQVLYPNGHTSIEYVLVPLCTGGRVTGAVLADRAFLSPTDISSDRLELLSFLTGEFALMLEAIRLRREEEETQTAMTITRGVNYSLRTRAAALEARLANLAYELGGRHQDSIDGLKRGLLFFKGMGTIAAKLIESGKVLSSESEVVDLNEVVDDVLANLSDARITTKLTSQTVKVRGERHYLDDVFWEIFWNACEFADRQTGTIEVTVNAEGDMVRVDCVDNGPGIHPDFRQHLFQPFKCYPASRMGLGLSYVSGLIERYGGTIEEIGRWEQGAHFVVRIPLAEGEEDE
jgi:signal transduction histidine kinase